MDDSTSLSAPSGLLLGIEGGATRTSVLLTSPAGEVLSQFQLGPCNVRLLSDDQLIVQLQAVASRLPVAAGSLAAAGIGLAGARSDAEKDRIRRAAARAFPGVPCHATNDLETALAAAPAADDVVARILVLSGTGSCCFGRGSGGRTARVGGRGHVIGDRGSAFDIGQRALRELLAHYDRRRTWPPLGTLILDALALNDPEDLIPWSMRADKSEIASLAAVTFRAAGQSCPLARGILRAASSSLAEDGHACASRLARPGQRVQFVFNGGVLLQNADFLQGVIRRLRRHWRRSVFSPLERSSVWGSVELARQAAAGSPPRKAAARRPSPGLPPPEVEAALSSSPTEQRNPRSMQLDRMPLPDAIDLMLDEESQVAAALRRERESLVWLIEKVVRAFRRGGRLFYVGAGTSGRLGVLDASEIPPTFRAPREQVQGIIAGGQQALWSAVEGAEDDPEAGAEAIRFRSVGPDDVVLGIAASGRTPFVWGALAEATARRATTALLAFNPAIRQPAESLRPRLVQRVLAPDLGPEVLTGSTRLKSGTATKLALNIITTLAMSRSGKVIGNLMIDLNPSNVKLRDRAVRILCQLTTASPQEARDALESSGWVVKEAHRLLTSQRGRRRGRS